jgi:biotin carboxyl carrier protein
VATAVRAHIAGTVRKIVMSFDDEVEEGRTVAVLESIRRKCRPKRLSSDA